MEDGEILTIGAINILAIGTPGHTDSHLAFLVNQEKLFTGDSLLIRGCGRTDFQSGSAETLFDIVTEKLFTLPDEIEVYPGHDYRGFTVSTIGEERKYNPRFKGYTRETFVKLMNELNLPNPQKMMAAVPANQLCGKAV
jgi:glyoxylase-like metal-dependent hydrolase (beta-lactamase superfamily II)